jgi:hypothetical protein
MLVRLKARTWRSIGRSSRIFPRRNRRRSRTASARWTSQRVTINIQSIEHRGQDAIVRLRRHDVIQAGGRQQTADSQQSITLVRAASGWVIREIGR